MNQSSKFSRCLCDWWCSCWNFWVKWTSSCTTEALWMEQWLESSQAEVLTNIPTLFYYNVTRITCYVFDLKILIKVYRCPFWYTFLSGAPKLEHLLITCSERLKHVYPKNVYQLRETQSTNLTSLASFIQTNKNSSATWPFLILNRSVWKMEISRKQKQQHGLGSKSQFR